VLDVQGFPAMLNWYLVHNRTKRLPPVAAAFKDFLLREGAPLIEQLVEFRFGVAPVETRARAAPPDVASPTHADPAHAGPARVARRRTVRPD